MRRQYSGTLRTNTKRSSTARCEKSKFRFTIIALVLVVLLSPSISWGDDERGITADEERQLDEMFKAMCVESVIAEAKSPDGRNVAVLKTRDCGAVTREVTHLFLLDSAHLDAKENSVFVAEFEGNARIRWISDRELEIRGKCRRLRTVTDLVGEVKLRVPECKDD